MWGLGLGTALHVPWLGVCTPSSQAPCGLGKQPCQAFLLCPGLTMESAGFSGCAWGLTEVSSSLTTLQDVMTASIRADTDELALPLCAGPGLCPCQAIKWGLHWTPKHIPAHSTKRQQLPR